MPRERLARLLETFFDEGPEMVERLRLSLRDARRWICASTPMRRTARR